MATDLMSLINGYLTTDVRQKLAAATGESPATTGKAVGAAVPALLGALIRNAGSETGAATLLKLLQGPGADAGLLGNLGAALGGGSATQGLLSTGQGLLKTILGDKLPAVVVAVAGASGARSSSISSLLALLAPLVMSVLGKQVSSQGLSASGLAGMLLGQRDLVSRLLPAGLGSTLDLAGLGSSVGAAAGGARKWLWPVLLAALIVAALLFLLRGCGGKVGDTARTATDSARQAGEAVGGAAQAVTEAVKSLARISLPGGVDLEVEEGTINYLLAGFLASSEGELPRTFTFDHLNFDSSSARITPESHKTVADLAAILNAYPAAEVRLEGHTDSTGDPEANRILSLDRANVVRDMLVAAGIAPARIATAGFGQDQPIAPNDSDEGRARNRRTDLVVVKR